MAFLSAEPKKTGKQDQANAAKAVIPKSAVHGGTGNAYVFSVNDGKLERRAVSLGRERGSDVEVIAGVNAGDEVVVSGPENLRDSQKVATRP